MEDHDQARKVILLLKTKLVAYTQHPEMSSEDFIAYCARVSNPGNQYNHETSDRLLAYLQRNHHWSPFEMVSAVIEIETTRDIARQILRHRSFSFQEFSQRYANPTSEESGLGFVTREGRLQDRKNRQNSIETNDEMLKAEWLARQDHLLEIVEQHYTWASENGIAKEQARAVLPEGLTKSRLYMSGTVRSWMHYCDLRCDNGTQKEHMQVAEACRQELKTVFPVLF